MHPAVMEMLGRAIDDERHRTATLRRSVARATGQPPRRMRRRLRAWLRGMLPDRRSGRSSHPDRPAIDTGLCTQ